MAHLTRREQLDIILTSRLKDPHTIFTYNPFRQQFLQVFFNQDPIFPSWATTALTHLRAHHTFDLSEYQELLANKKYYEGRIHDANLPIRQTKKTSSSGDNEDESLSVSGYTEIDVRNAVFYMHLNEMLARAEARIKLSENKIKAWDDDIRAIEQLTKVYYCSPQDLYTEEEGEGEGEGEEEGETVVVDPANSQGLES